MSRGGDSGTFTLDLVAANLTGGNKFKVTLETKAHEDAGNGDSVLDTNFKIETSTIGQSSDDCDEAMKDLVRYKFAFTTNTADDWVLFRMVPPSWYDDVTTA